MFILQVKYALCMYCTNVKVCIARIKAVSFLLLVSYVYFYLFSHNLYH